MGLGAVTGAAGCHVNMQLKKKKSSLSPEISWPQIREAGALSVNDRVSPGEAQQACGGAAGEEVGVMLRVFV